MAHYEYNKETYKVITIRINRNTDADIIEKLEEQKSVNAYIINLIRKDMNLHTSAEYDVIEVMKNQNHVVASFNTLEAARDFLEYYALNFPDAGFPVRIVRKFNATLANGKQVIAGEIAGSITGIEKTEEEEKTNA